MPGVGAVRGVVDSAVAVEWLLDSAEPAASLLTRRVEHDPDQILAGPIVRALLGGQGPARPERADHPERAPNPPDGREAARLTAQGLLRTVAH